MNKKIIKSIAVAVGMIGATILGVGVVQNVFAPDGFSKTFDVGNSSGLSVESAGIGESVVIKNNAWLFTVGGYPSSTHYARIKYKLPEREGMVMTTFYMKTTIVIPPDFYDRQMSGLRVMNTDNYRTLLNGVPVGASGSAEFRTGVYIHKDHSLRVRSDHDHVSVKDFFKMTEPLSVGEHVLELYGDVSKVAPWYLKIDGEMVASGYAALTADTVSEGERVITRLVAGIDGASDQDDNAVSLSIGQFVIADHDVSEPIPTLTPTASQAIVTPTLTLTPTLTVPIATLSPTITLTPTPTLPSIEKRCVIVTWNRGLSLRPSPSMFNISYKNMNFGRDAVIPVESIFDNAEGKWMKVNSWLYSAMWLKSNNTTYAIATECP